MSLTATLDKSNYNSGDKVTLTVVRSPGATQSQTFTVTITGQTGDSVTTTLVLNGKPGETLTVSDTGSHVWTSFSDDGTTAVYNTTV
jgi:hypothetical protein